ALIVLDMEGIAVSAGSACESGAVQASHVLKAIGLSEKEARSTIRISLGRENTEAEADQIAETIAKVNERLLKLRKGFR
ncbi:MAG: aminotransferase class V-fold PLP-dependent enzyme, partial [Firmicutes bacterium]|nr:aminotransferase class V-fold PLP-dependent enzyme [Bacillota bacterium]